MVCKLHLWASIHGTEFEWRLLTATFLVSLLSAITEHVWATEENSHLDTILVKGFRLLLEPQPLGDRKINWLASLDACFLYRVFLLEASQSRPCSLRDIWSSWDCPSMRHARFMSYLSTECSVILSQSGACSLKSGITNAPPHITSLWRHALFIPLRI